MSQKASNRLQNQAQNVLLAYAYVTALGVSNTVASRTIGISGNEAVSFQPTVLPSGAIGYQPQVVYENGQTLTYSPKPGGTKTEFIPGVSIDDVLSGNVPDAEDQTPGTEGNTTAQDNSGIDAPDAELSDMVGMGATLPVPGTYRVRLTKFTIDPDDQREDESAPGPEASIDITVGHYLRVKPPRDYQNWLSNPQVAARKNDAARTPEGWERNQLETVTVTDPVPGVQTVTDVSTSTDDHEVIVTPPVKVDRYLEHSSDLLRFPTLCARSVVEIPKATYDGGALQISIRETLTNDTIVDTVIHTADTADTHDVVIRMADEIIEPPFDHFAFNPLVKSFQMVYTCIGSSDAGSRRLVANIMDVGVVLGESIPLKRIEEQARPLISQQVMETFFPNLKPGNPINTLPATPHEPIPGIKILPPDLHDHEPGHGDIFPPAIPPVSSPPVEPPAAPYPTFGYSTVVINPPEDQRAIMTPAEGLDPIAYVPGNMVEYYGPKGMPVTPTFFLGGMKSPVKQEERWTDSFYFFWRGVTQPATPLKAVLKNKQHVVIADLGTFEGMSGVTGDSADEPDADANGYVRRSLTVIVPLGNPLLVNPLDDLEHGAAYIEIIPGGVGDGLFRIMGGQHERGEAMTPFSIEHEEEGSLITTFDMGVPGVPQGELPQHAKVKWYVDMDAEVTEAMVNGEVVSSYLVEAAVKTYASGSYSSFTTDLEALEVPSDTGYNLRLRTTLSTEDITVTPEMNSHFIDFEREYEMGAGFGALCRSDGTEFDGTVRVFDFPPTRNQKPIISEEYADRTKGFGVMGESTRYARGFGIECYLNSTAEEIVELIGEFGSDEFDDEDASAFLIEIFDTRYLARILDMEIVPVTRESHRPIPGMEADGGWILQATGIEAEILSWEIF